MSTEDKKTSVYTTMRTILSFIDSPGEQKNRAGYLAAIRKSIGKRNEEAAEVWPILFPHIPQEYLGTGSLNYAEKALLVSLQLYAIGQQGTDKTQNEEGISFGSSLQRIRDEKSAPLDNRFNAMLTATTFDEFTYHLRQIYKLGKAKSTFSVSFPALAQDLFWYQAGRDKYVCLKWARDYYRQAPKNNNDKS